MLKIILQKNILIGAIVLLGDMLLSYVLHGRPSFSESLLIAAAVFGFFTLYDLYKMKKKG